MLPRSGGTAAPSQQAPQGGNRRQGGGFDYVRNTDLSTDKKRARVLACRVNDAVVKEGQRKYSDVIVKIALNGKTLLYGLKADNPEYEKLVNAFGEDENRWPDREFYMYLEADDFTGKYWMRVEPIEAEPKSAKKKSGGN